jgi:hypothetical protein
MLIPAQSPSIKCEPREALKTVLRTGKRYPHSIAANYPNFESFEGVYTEWRGYSVFSFRTAL